MQRYVLWSHGQNRNVTEFFLQFDQRGCLLHVESIAVSRVHSRDQRTAGKVNKLTDSRTKRRRPSSDIEMKGSAPLVPVVFGCHQSSLLWIMHRMIDEAVSRSFHDANPPTPFAYRRTAFDRESSDPYIRTWIKIMLSICLPPFCPLSLAFDDQLFYDTEKNRIPALGFTVTIRYKRSSPCLLALATWIRKLWPICIRKLQGREHHLYSQSYHRHSLLLFLFSVW